MDSLLPYLEKYVNKELAPYLSLHHWIFHISEEQAEEGAWCEIDVEDYNEATVKIGTKFRQASNAVKVQALIHELCHIPVVRIFENVEAATDCLTQWIPEKKRSIAKSQLALHYKTAHRAEELFVNHLGIILAPHAPKFRPPTK